MSFSADQKDSSATSTKALDPQVSNLLNTNIDHVQTMASAPYQPYSGSLVASFTPAQLQAQDAFTGIANNQTGAGPLQAGINLAQGVGAYAPQQITAQGMATEAANYMNPYQSQVIDSTLQDLQRQQQIQDQTDASKATLAGAFGGSRSAVLQNLDHDSYARAAASAVANLNQQGYTQAQNAALQTATANQNAGLQGASLNLNAANALASMGGQQLGQALQRAGALSTAGGAQQQNQQAQLDAAYQQWQLAQQYPIQMQQLLNQTIGMMPTDLGTTSQTGSSTDFGLKADLTQPLKLFGAPIP